MRPLYRMNLNEYMRDEMAHTLPLTMSRNDANVSWYALTIHAVSSSDIPIDWTIVSAVKSAARL